MATFGIGGSTNLLSNIVFSNLLFFIEHSLIQQKANNHRNGSSLSKVAYFVLIVFETDFLELDHCTRPVTEMNHKMVSRT